jgi:RNA polymerase sigma-70 factor (ECF subfamily)
MNTDPTFSDVFELLAEKFAGGPDDVADGLALLDARLKPFFWDSMRRKFPTLRDPDREDVWQATLETIWKKVQSSSFDANKGFRWVRKVVRLRAFDHLRRRNARQTAERHVTPSDPVPSTVDTVLRQEAEAEALKGLDQIWLLVDALPEPDRSILVMRFSGGKKYREIANTLTMPSGSVASRIFRSLKAIRELLGLHLEDLL